MVNVVEDLKYMLVNCFKRYISTFYYIVTNYYTFLCQIVVIPDAMVGGINFLYVKIILQDGTKI